MKRLILERFMESAERLRDAAKAALDRGLTDTDENIRLYHAVQAFSAIARPVLSKPRPKRAKR